MFRKKIALLMAASVFLTGASGALVGSMVPAHAITSVEELRDVDSSHWAYEALADLVEKYDVIEGYPDYTFRGDRQATRWELAAALNALIKAVGRDLARLGAEKANKSDLATLARLQEEFRNELAALNARVGALESRASAIEAKNSEQDTRLDLLEKTQLHGDFSIGFLADVGDNGLGAGVGSTAGDLADGITTLGRLRLGIEVPVIEGNDDSPVGQGDVVARLVGAFGRWTPQGAVAAGTRLINPISGYSAIAGGASGFNEGVQVDSYGIGGVTIGLDTRQNFYVESAYYRQHYKPGIPIITDLLPGINVFPDNDNYRTTADMYVGVIPWRFLFAKSPYRGDELNQFQNTALVTNQGMLVNNVTPTFAMAWHQGLGEHFSADLTGAVGSFDNSDFMAGMWISEELNFNYDTSFLGDDYTKPGNIYFGGYHLLSEGRATLLANARATLLANAGGAAFNRDGVLEPIFGFAGNAATDDVNAFYTGWNQEWWRGIGTSVDWVVNSTNANNALINALRNGTGSQVQFMGTGIATGIASALSATITVPLTVFDQDLTKRAKDVFGFGYSWIDPQDIGDNGPLGAAGSYATATFNNTSEHVFETFYRWVVNDSVSVIPSMQVILNRFGVGENDADVIFGLRTNYVF